MSFEAIPDHWRQQYLKRPLDKLPADLTRACDQIRMQRRDIDTLRAQLRRANIKNAVLIALVGGAAAKGIEVAVIQCLKLLSH